jgi:hypothetical protein
VSILSLAGITMPKCIECGAETKLYVNGVPVCPKCEEKRNELNSAAKEPKSEHDLKHTATKPS